MAATSNVNGLNLIEGTFHLPRSGAWHADITVDTTDVSLVSGRLTVTLTGGSLVLIGTPIRTPIAWRGVTRLRMVAGAAGLRSELPPQGYNNISAKIILGDVAVSCAEQVSATADATMLGAVYPQWSRMRGSGGAAIYTLAAELGAVWRMLPDGTIWMGTETWPTVTPANVDVLSVDSEAGSMSLGVETISMLPGTLFQGFSVGRVTHFVHLDKLRTELLFDDV